MDEESIIRLAKEAGIYYREIEDEFCEADKDGVPIKMMAKFAALVAAAEREACAKVCDEKYESVPKNDPYAEADGDYSDLIYAGAAQDCAEAIRARGDT